MTEWLIVVFNAISATRAISRQGIGTLSNTPQKSLQKLSILNTSCILLKTELNQYLMILKNCAMFKKIHWTVPKLIFENCKGINKGMDGHTNLFGGHHIRLLKVNNQSYCTKRHMLIRWYWFTKIKQQLEKEKENWLHKTGVDLITDLPPCPAAPNNISLMISVACILCRIVSWKMSKK